MNFWVRLFLVAFLLVIFCVADTLFLGALGASPWLIIAVHLLLIAWSINYLISWIMKGTHHGKNAPKP